MYDSDGDGVNDTSYVDCDGNCLSDIDGDGVCDEVDNCPEIFNPDQEDNDEPGGSGDPCDGINLDEDEPININLFPNPASSILNISYEALNIDDVELIILNSVGQLVYNDNYPLVTNFEIQLDIENYSSGIYQILISTKKGFNLNKLVLKE